MIQKKIPPTTTPTIQLKFDYFDAKMYYLLINDKTIDLTINSIYKLKIQKKLNYNCFLNFIIAELLFLELTTYFYSIPYTILILLGIIRFLIFSDVFYIPLFKVEITINSENYTLQFSDESVFTDFLMLKDRIEQKT